MSSLDLRHRRWRQRDSFGPRNLKCKQRAKAQRRAVKAIMYSWAYGWPLREKSAEDPGTVPKWKEWTQAPADTIASMVFPDYKAKDTLSRRVKRAQWDRRRFEQGVAALTQAGLLARILEGFSACARRGLAIEGYDKSMGETCSFYIIPVKGRLFEVAAPPLPNRPELFILGTSLPKAIKAVLDHYKDQPQEVG